MTARNYGAKSDGRFKAGNPGKPKGARHRTTIMAEQLMQDDEEAIVRAVIGAAKGGDMTAARLILERIAPVRKGRLMTLNLPATETAADVNTAMTSVVAQMAAGEITPDEAGAVVGVLEAKHRAQSVTDLERRMQELEAKLSEKRP